MEFFSRIEAIKSLVPNGARLLDIGTDHALLPIQLISDGIIQYAIASDVNSGPLKRAEKIIVKLNLSNQIHTVLSDGFQNIRANSFNCVAICGMGGHLIWDIIQNGGDKAKNCSLILQPMSYPEALRKKLLDNGYSIKNEVFAIDNYKPYVIMQVEYVDVPQTYTDIDLHLGFFRPENICYKMYESKVKRRFIKRLTGLLRKKIDDLNYF